MNTHTFIVDRNGVNIKEGDLVEFDNVVQPFRQCVYCKYIGAFLFIPTEEEYWKHKDMKKFLDSVPDPSKFVMDYKTVLRGDFEVV